MAEQNRRQSSNFNSSRGVLVQDVQGSRAERSHHQWAFRIPMVRSRGTLSTKLVESFGDNTFWWMMFAPPGVMLLVVLVLLFLWLRGYACPKRLI